MENQAYSEILGVLGGEDSIKVEHGFDTQNMIFVGLIIMVSILLAYVFGNLILKSL